MTKLQELVYRIKAIANRTVGVEDREALEDAAVRLEKLAQQVQVTVEELAEQIAVGVHTGLRKGSEAKSSADLWQAISKSEDSAWTDAAEFCAHGLKSMGYTVTRDAD